MGLSNELMLNQDSKSNDFNSFVLRKFNHLMSIYLDFEEPIQAIEEQIEKTKEIGESTDVDMSDKIQELELKLKKRPKRFLQI